MNDYNTIIDKMVEEKIVSTPGIWKSKKYSEQNAMDLIVKVSSYLKSR
nr:hypothetical protein [uncultured Niameybacter sp.]